MSTKAAKKAMEAAETLLQDSKQELDNAAKLLQDVEEELATKMRAERERKEGETRSRDQLQE
eukprot:2097719-Heterocapsa_arctica.AAC.1